MLGIWNRCERKTIRLGEEFTEEHQTWREEWVRTKVMPKKPKYSLRRRCLGAERSLREKDLEILDLKMKNSGREQSLYGKKRLEEELIRVKKANEKLAAEKEQLQKDCRRWQNAKLNADADRRAIVENHQDITVGLKEKASQADAYHRDLIQKSQYARKLEAQRDKWELDRKMLEGRLKRTQEEAKKHEEEAMKYSEENLQLKAAGKEPQEFKKEKHTLMKERDEADQKARYWEEKYVTAEDSLRRGRIFTKQLQKNREEEIARRVVIALEQYESEELTAARNKLDRNNRNLSRVVGIYAKNEWLHSQSARMAYFIDQAAKEHLKKGEPTVRKMRSFCKAAVDCTRELNKAVDSQLLVEPDLLDTFLYNAPPRREAPVNENPVDEDPMDEGVDEDPMEEGFVDEDPFGEDFAGEDPVEEY